MATSGHALGGPARRWTSIPAGICTPLSGLKVRSRLRTRIRLAVWTFGGARGSRLHGRSQASDPCGAGSPRFQAAGGPTSSHYRSETLEPSVSWLGKVGAKMENKAVFDQLDKNYRFDKGMFFQLVVDGLVSIIDARLSWLR